MKIWKEEFCRRAAKDKFPIFEPYFNLTQQQKDWLWHGLPSDKNRPKEMKGPRGNGVVHSKTMMEAPGRRTS